MSVKLMAAAFYLNLPGPEKLLLLAICDHTDDDGQQAFPSQVRLARKASVSTRTVRRLTRILEEKGLISVKPGFGPETTLYHVNAEILLSGCGGDKLSGGERTNCPEGSGQICGGGADIAMSAKPLEATIKKLEAIYPHKPGTKQSAAEDFLRFWAAYPKHENRKKTQAEWQRLKPDTGLQEQILAAITEQRRGRNWIEGFIPAPFRWLRDERWNDSVLPAGRPAVDPYANFPRDHP